MSLREEMWKYEEITGESAEHVPIIKLGAFLDGYDMGIKALGQEPKWILTSERLPEEFADVFCSTDAEELFIATYLGKMNDGVDCFDDDNGMMWEGNVIAWMPLPKPYKAESEG